MKVQMWTDGGGQNPGTTGWCAILVIKNRVRLLGGFEMGSTNNRAETLAVIGGLSAIHKPCDVTIYTDSKQYVMSGIRRLSHNSVLQTNIDLWKKLKPAYDRQKSVEVIFVRGHNKIKLNEIADFWAGECAREKLDINKLFNNEQELLVHAITSGMPKRKIR